ncbi:MAG: type IV pilus modification PilV family protein [Candidatus Deferrimicrobiaceae bacterium]
MERRRKRREEGFSLLEVFVALLILSIGILFLAMVQLTALTAKAPFSSSNPRTATELAQEAIDHLFRLPWGELRSSHPDGFQTGPEGVSPAFIRLSASSGDSVTVRGTTFYRVWQVAPDPEIPNLKTITVWCSWRSGKSSWRQTMLVTQRADAGY